MIRVARILVDDKKNEVERMKELQMMLITREQGKREIIAQITQILQHRFRIPTLPTS